MTALAGCQLYFEPDGPGAAADAANVVVDAGAAGDARATIDARGPDAPEPGTCGRYAYCGGDGARFVTPPLGAGSGTCPPDDIFARGEAAGRCEGSCAIDSAAYPCTTPDCADELRRTCGPPPSCPATGDVCTGDVRCTVGARCGRSAVQARCVCGDDGRYTCTDNVSALRAAMIGSWQGTVYPPSFASPYAVRLTFAADGTYWADGMPTTAFYYGSDGGGAGRRWGVLGDAEDGPIVRLDVYFGVYSIRTSMLTGVQLSGDRLRFTFWDAWLDCSRPFTFDLRRM